MELQKISNDLDQLEQEISSAEKELAAAMAQKELLQKQGQQYGVSNIKEAKANIVEYKSKLEKNEKEIVDGYGKLKNEFVWGE